MTLVAMYRRQYLATLGIGTSAALAGCGSSSESNSMSGSGGTEANSGEQTTVQEATSAITEAAGDADETMTTEAAAAEEATTAMMDRREVGGETPTAEAQPTFAQTPEATEIAIETPSLTPTSNQQGDAYYETLIELALRDTDVSVSSISLQGPTVQLTYTTFQTTEEGLAEEIGKVAGAFTYAVGDGWNKQQMQVSILAADGTEIGTFQVQRSWAQQYNNGEITAEEFMLQVLQTLEITG